MMADDGETAIAVGAAAASPLSAAPRTAGGVCIPRDDSTAGVDIVFGKRSVSGGARLNGSAEKDSKNLAKRK